MRTKENKLLDLSMEFAVEIIKLTKFLKDKKESKSPENRPEYKYQVPLTFIPGLGAKTVDKLLSNFGTEMTILHKLTEDDIEAVIGQKIAKENFPQSV